jgi:uncharacterized protein (TIGR00369 family)
LAVVITPGPARDAEIGFPLARFLGMAIDKPEARRALASLEAGEQHANPHGFVHGAVLFALVDTAMGAATYDVLGPDQSCASIEVHMRFLRPVTAGGVVLADVRIVHAGRKVVHLEGRVTSGDRLVALASGSFAVIDISTSVAEA